MGALTPYDIAAAFIAACDDELSALKPGNVHRFSDGHRMIVEDFERSAQAAAGPLSKADSSVGERILGAVEATFAAVGQNTNLGIILLCAPLAKAAGEIDVGTGLRRRLAIILSRLDVSDAENAFKAIRLANPAGLGRVEEGDVSQDGPAFSFLEAMTLAADRDRIARAYVTAYEDIFDFAIPAFQNAFEIGQNRNAAITTLHMSLLANIPDSHIERKFGIQCAEDIRAEAAALKSAWSPATDGQTVEDLENFDRSLKQRGINPGTTADFVVATLFALRISQLARV